MSRRLLVCCALVAAVACGGASSVVPSGASLSGVWTLRTINDAALPYGLPYSPNGEPTTILGATLTISGTGAGSYTEVVAVRVSAPAAAIDTSLTFSGTWSVNGASVTFQDGISPDAYQGSVLNDTIVTFVLFGYSGKFSR